jgi:hypothetical protein
VRYYQWSDRDASLIECERSRTLCGLGELPSVLVSFLLFGNYLLFGRKHTGSSGIRQP